MQLWLKAEIFFHGVVCAHQKLNFSYLKKVLAYAKSKGSDGGYPYLNWTIWKHMAVNKMLLSEELAWTYFNLFYTLSEKDRSHWLQLSENQQASFETGNSNSFKDKMRVPTLQFVVFLYIQQANKVTLRKSMLGEDWPGANSRLNFKATANDSIPKLSNDSKYMEFIISHLSQLLEIVSENPGDDEKPIFITMEVVRALSGFIVGRLDDLSSVQKLHEIAKKEPCRFKSGFDKTSRTFVKSQFVSWLTDCLVHNPCDMQTCLTLGTKLKWVLPGPPTSKSTSSSRKAKICYNPNLGISSHKTVVLFQVIDQTVAQQSNVLWKSHVMIHKCHKSFIYLLSPLKFVSIERCQECTIVLGPISTSLKVIDCRDVTIITPCRSVIVCSSTNIILHVNTPNQPIIILDGTGEQEVGKSVTLAPYNTFYSNLGSHLVEIGLSLSSETNQWSNPAVISSNSRSSRSKRTIKEDDDNGDAVMPPEDFYTFAIPFKSACNKYETSEIPWKLPAEYEQAVKNKQAALDKWKKTFREVNLTKEQQTQFKEMIESRFDEWVADTGNKRQLTILGFKDTA